MPLEVPGTLRIPVAVLAERRPAATRWADWSWRAIEVVRDAPAMPDWTVLREEAGRTLFFAGATEVVLSPTDTPNYRDNLTADPPLIWVVLRPVEAEPGFALHVVTVDAGEAQLYADSGADLMESLPLPDWLRPTIDAFVMQHHVERARPKRRREEADPEALGKRPGGRRGP